MTVPGGWFEYRVLYRRAHWSKSTSVKTRTFRTLTAAQDYANRMIHSRQAAGPVERIEIAKRFVRVTRSGSSTVKHPGQWEPQARFPLSHDDVDSTTGGDA